MENSQMGHMREFEVTVYTRVREVYAIEAESAEDALSRWEEGSVVLSECESIEDIGSAVEVVL